MTGGVICSVITPHTPRMGVEDSAPDFVRGLIAGSRELGEALRAMKPDLIVIHSTHWVSTFNWYATCQPRHEGYCVADEAPDMIPGLPYSYAGDPEYAGALVEAVSAAGIPCFRNESEHFAWDYAIYVPLKYIDPGAEVPMVALPVCVSADLDESKAVGRKVHETAVGMGRRVVFIASNALSHKILRGPEKWPEAELQELDHKFIGLLEAGRAREAIDWLPEYSRLAVAEMGGRCLASFMGTLEALGDVEMEGRQYGPYGQSSGSGNASIAVTPVN